jgi:predicted transcriptional regulator
MDRKQYIDMLETKEDEWIGVLQERRAHLEQEDIADEESECEKERARIQELEKRLSDISAKRKQLSESGDNAWEELKRELDKSLEEFTCDIEAVVYYEDESAESNE